VAKTARTKRKTGGRVAKNNARARSSRKKAVARKAVSRKRTTAPGKRATARKTAVARKRVGRKRAARAVAFNPQLQLSKVAADAPATRGASRGIESATLPAGFFSAFTGAAVTEQDYADAAQTLGCEVAAVKAVAQVETAGASFDASRRPTILYERHVFSRSTVPTGKFDQASPDLSAAKGYPPGGYGTKDQQFVKLAQAFQLDPDAALKAASWGKFQILGENHKACGFATVAEFVKAMTTSESEHLKAFIRFMRADPRKLQAIREKNWAALAKLYNGSDYAKFKYDTKLAAAYAAHAQVPTA
jgi:hypothetical protein